MVKFSSEMHIYAKMFLKRVSRNDASITSSVKSAKVIGSELKSDIWVAGSVMITEGVEWIIEK